MKLIPLILLLTLIPPCQPAFAINYTNEEIADAVFKSEGGMKAQYWYGIRSVKYDSLKEARKICLNTIRNQRKRHSRHNCELTYLECLHNRYAPPNVNNDPNNLNRYWLIVSPLFSLKRRLLFYHIFHTNPRIP